MSEANPRLLPRNLANMRNPSLIVLATGCKRMMDLSASEAVEALDIQYAATTTLAKRIANLTDRHMGKMTPSALQALLDAAEVAQVRWTKLWGAVEDCVRGKPEEPIADMLAKYWPPKAQVISINGGAS